jgi:NAD+ diphosphatase
MLGYQADFDTGDIVCAADELEDAAFFHVDRLPAAFPGKATIAHWLLRDFCRRHGRSLPVTG